jgi:hypothetical protein
MHTQVVDTRPLLGEFRERGSRGNTKRRNFVRGYSNRWEDTYRSMLHAWQVEVHAVDWAIKLDMDTTFFAENFRRMLSDKGFCSPDKQPLLLGHILMHRTHPFAAGAGFALSRAALVQASEYMNRTLVVEETPERATCVPALFDSPGTRTSVRLKRIQVQCSWTETHISLGI